MVRITTNLMQQQFVFVNYRTRRKIVRMRDFVLVVMNLDPQRCKPAAHYPKADASSNWILCDARNAAQSALPIASKQETGRLLGGAVRCARALTASHCGTKFSRPLQWIISVSSDARNQPGRSLRWEPIFLRSSLLPCLCSADRIGFAAERRKNRASKRKEPSRLSFRGSPKNK